MRRGNAIIYGVILITLVIIMNILLYQSNRIVKKSKDIIDIELSNVNRILENCKMANYIESLNLFKEKKFTTINGDTTQINDVLKHTNNIVLWIDKNFCQTCVFETLKQLDKNLTPYQKQSVTIIRQKTVNQEVSQNYFSNNTYFFNSDINVFQENRSVEAILFMVDKNLKINLGIVVDSHQMELIIFTIKLMRNVIGFDTSIENAEGI